MCFIVGILPVKFLYRSEIFIVMYKCARLKDIIGALTACGMVLVAAFMPIAVAYGEPTIEEQAHAIVEWFQEHSFQSIDTPHIVLVDASHVQGDLAALYNGQAGDNSADTSIPRFTWWDRKGTVEWVQYLFNEPITVDSTQVYWFDDSGFGGCRVPESWRLLYRDNSEWKPLPNPGQFGVEPDKHNAVNFDSVHTDALRLEVKLQDGYSAGILDWRVPGISEPEGDDNYRAAAQSLWARFEQRFPIPADWILQDAFGTQLWDHVPAGGRENARPQRELIGSRLALLLYDMNAPRWDAMLNRVLAELGNEGNVVAEARSALEDTEDPVLIAALYLKACELRRIKRLAPMTQEGTDGIVFACHYNLGASHYAYTEGLSDAQSERHFLPGSSMQLLRLDNGKVQVETLLEDEGGVIRDVDVSWDGKTILFSWKKSDREDDFSLYTMDVATREITAITGELGHADYEGVFAPNGDIIFNSTRCVQTVDCWWTEVSNLYTCAPDGRFMRRLSFDQVHTNFPTPAEDGRILYTRWDYNDRGQLFPQGLFQMFPDGTAQQEFYGNNSWFPTTILHARQIPGTQQVLAIFTGHHSFQAGKLGILDLTMGRQENAGTQLIAPVRETPAERIDAYGQEGDLSKYPWPLDTDHFLVSYAPRGWHAGIRMYDKKTVFGLYFMDRDGRRELLFRDDKQQNSVGRMVPLTPRRTPHQPPSMVDYAQDTGVYYVQDVYDGEGLEGVPRGTIKALRVVALEYRAAGIGENRNHGPAGSSLISTPVSIFGSWDVKTVLGTTPVHADGSALFEVPARTPVYFQALDEKGHAVQSMRSWSTLQPGERFSCIGCHSTAKHAAPTMNVPSLAMRAGVQPLERKVHHIEGFSFRREVQPILDRHCISCHNAADAALGGDSAPFSLESTPRHDETAKRYWSDAYLALTQPHKDGGYHAPYEGPVRWVDPQSPPEVLPPYYTGAATSPLIKILEDGHHDVVLSPEEMQTLATWIDLSVPFIGDYTEANAWSDEEVAKYNYFLNKRKVQERLEQENIQAYIEHLSKK